MTYSQPSQPQQQVNTVDARRLFAGMEQKINNFGTDLAVLNTKVENLEKDADKKVELDTMNARFDGLEAMLEKMHSDIKDNRKDVKHTNRLILGLCFTIVIAPFFKDFVYSLRPQNPNNTPTQIQTTP